jgi:hypothetical protein
MVSTDRLGSVGAPDATLSPKVRIPNTERQPIERVALYAIGSYERFEVAILQDVTRIRS